MVGFVIFFLFVFGVRFGVWLILYFLLCDGFGRVRVLLMFLWSEDVVGKYFVVKSKGVLLFFVVMRSMGMIVVEDVEGDGEVFLLCFLERLKNYEKEGVLKGVGIDFVVGFDLECMEWFFVCLGNLFLNYLVEFFLLF